MKLTAEGGAGKILLRGLIDWVSLDEARWLVARAEPSDVPFLERDPTALRESSLAAIAALVEQGLARLGDVRPRFEPWDLSTEAALERLRREWAI